MDRSPLKSSHRSVRGNEIHSEQHSRRIHLAHGQGLHWRRYPGTIWRDRRKYLEMGEHDQGICSDWRRYRDQEGLQLHAEGRSNLVALMLPTEAFELLRRIFS